MKRIVLFSLFATLLLNPTAAQGPYDSGTYYQDADGKKGAELKTALCGIIYDRWERTYKQLWEDFMITDVRSDGTIWDLYSCTTSYEPVTSGSNYKIEGDCYNREHSFPNSWFGKKVQPMYTDLHHLYPTDGYVNGRRGNYPFGETDGEIYKSENDHSKLGVCTYPGYTGIVFEPADEYKGDFARTYFYMVTCYEEKIVDWYNNYEDSRPTLDGKTYPGLSDWQLSMLMKWAYDDPVSEKEINRNNAVYSIQNNRNPFIDYPGLEQYVWGALTDIRFRYDTYKKPNYLDTSIGISHLEGEHIQISSQGGALCVISDTEASLRITNITGAVCRLLNVSKGTNYIEGLNSGIYLINNKKFIIP